MFDVKDKSQTETVWTSPVEGLQGGNQDRRMLRLGLAGRRPGGRVERRFNGREKKRTWSWLA